ncbi:HAD-IIB family hydrolase [Deinococcus radiopugnans]|uniref:HAD superfamily hydrolase (TIGR01484 family) n=1 Tax=Deinococcus radiopugnans ATCC 19172 TaxID=585398 RepID=A0ABR6NP92_9DEIO|nr:HAD-IIB family hydrolase [Deinococcus radiopugnans]MBB6015854.1 HAD superfamily hydrolase (TIGR01484 family) [Deinococcus radiopugnans ATCC 19172]
MIVAFTDLDDTLFQTLRKLPPGMQGLTPATLGRNGQPHSFCTPAQAALLAHFEASGITVIPVTGRDPAAMARVTLPFTSWRVLDHGLTILRPDGQVDAEWRDRVLETLHPLQDALEECTVAVSERAAALGCRLSRHTAHDTPFMTVLKHPDADAGRLEQVQLVLEAHLATRGYADLHVIANANNVSVLPRHLGKAEAVRHLREQHFPQAALTLALGDSLSDLAFMNACDLALTPPGGQLLRTLTAAKLPQR